LNVFFTLECNFAIPEFNYAVIAVAIFTLKFDFVGFQKLLLTIQFYFVVADIVYYFPKNYVVQPIPANKTFFLAHWSNFTKQCFNFLNQHFHFLIPNFHCLVFISQFCKFKIHFPSKSVYFLHH